MDYGNVRYSALSLWKDRSGGERSGFAVRGVGSMLVQPRIAYRPCTLRMPLMMAFANADTSV